MNQCRWACVIVVAAAVSACSGPEAGEGSGTAVERWSLQRVATIDPSADSVFDHITTVLADERGEIYVSTEGSAGIHVYDSLGKPLRVLGRPGAGPGEFRRKYSIAWAGDTIAVYDAGNGRVEFIDRDGRWVASHPTARSSGGFFHLYPTGQEAFYSPTMVAAAGDSEPTFALVNDGLQGSHDTLTEPPRGDLWSEYAVLCQGDGFTAWSGPDAPSQGLAVSPRGELISWRTDLPMFTFTNVNHDTTRTIRLNQAPIPLTDSAWSAQQGQFEEAKRKLGHATCKPSGPKRPATVALLRSIVFDDEGQAWIEAMQRDTMMLAVYDTAGRQIAAMPAPERDLDVPNVIRGDRLYEVERDEDGLQRIVVYQVID